VNINKNTCNKCLIAISSFDGWLNSTQEVSIENNFTLIPEISINTHIYKTENFRKAKPLPLRPRLPQQKNSRACRQNLHKKMCMKTKYK
jgi:hypothetical protein